MAETLTIRSERIDDIRVLIGVAKHLKLAEVLDRHLGTHGLQQGLSNGWLTVGWLVYLLSQGGTTAKRRCASGPTISRTRWSS